MVLTTLILCAYYSIFFVFQLFDAFVSFRKPDTAEVEEEEELSPGMAKIIGKLDEQEKRFLTPFM